MLDFGAANPDFTPAFSRRSSIQPTTGNRRGRLFWDQQLTGFAKQPERRGFILNVIGE